MELAQGVERRGGKMPRRAMPRLHQLRQQDGCDVGNVLGVLAQRREQERQLGQAREQAGVETKLGGEARRLLSRK